MNKFLVTVVYDPGTPKSYVVEDVMDAREARAFVRDKIIGYDPGVAVEITQIPIHLNKTVRYSNLGGCHD